MRVRSAARVEFFRFVHEAWCQGRHDPRHRQLEGHDKPCQDEHQNSKHLICEPLRSAHPLAFQPAREDRNEDRIEGALGKQAAEEIG